MLTSDYFQRRLRQLRECREADKEHPLPLEQLAEKAKMPVQEILELEKGTRIGDRTALERLAKALGEPLNDLLGRDFESYLKERTRSKVKGPGDQ